MCFMELIQVENMDRNTWDGNISKFDTNSLFHKSAWLEFIKQTQMGEKLILEIREKNKVVGYFVGFIIQKGPFKILGSPLIGWTTEFMGPIVNGNFDQEEFLNALELYCKFNRIDQLELSSPILKVNIMQSHGFQCNIGVTPILKLHTDEETMWHNLEPKSCRYSIRKALRSGIIIEETDSPKIVDEYYDQLIGIFDAQGSKPAYPRYRVQKLFECLKEDSMLFALQAKHNNKVIATGLFPHDDNYVCYWGGASYLDYRNLCPNELIQWTLITIAAKKGIKIYNMYGGDNHFKLKFGSKPINVYYWYKSFNPLAKVARSLYNFQFKSLRTIERSIKNPSRAISRLFKRLER